jgi:hypothetical protein
MLIIRCLTGVHDSITVKKKSQLIKYLHKKISKSTKKIFFSKKS